MTPLGPANPRVGRYGYGPGLSARPGATGGRTAGGSLVPAARGVGATGGSAAAGPATARRTTQAACTRRVPDIVPPQALGRSRTAPSATNAAAGNPMCGI